MEQTEHNLRQQTELYGEPLGTLMRRIGGTLGLTQARLAETIGLSAPMLSQLMSGQRVKIGNPAVVSRLHSLDLLVTRVTEQGLEEAQIAIELTEIKGSTGAFTRSATISPSGTPSAGQPNSGQANVGQGTSGQSISGQTSGGQAQGGQPHGGQPHGGQPQGGQPGDGQGGGQGSGGQGNGGEGATGSATTGQGSAGPQAIGGATHPTADGSGPRASNQPPPARAVVREIQDLFRSVASADEVQRAAGLIVAESPGLAELLLAYGAGRTDDAVAHYERHH